MKNHNCKAILIFECSRVGMFKESQEACNFYEKHPIDDNMCSFQTKDGICFCLEAVKEAEKEFLKENKDIIKELGQTLVEGIVELSNFYLVKDIIEKKTGNPRKP